MTRNPSAPLWRASAAAELRSAAALRRDMICGVLPRAPAISAIRDCLRHARACTVAARLVGGLA